MKNKLKILTLEKGKQSGTQCRPSEAAVAAAFDDEL